MLIVLLLTYIDTEENGAKLKDDILAKTGEITDVLSCIGRMGKPGKVLDVSLDEFNGVSMYMCTICCKLLYTLLQCFCDLSMQYVTVHGKTGLVRTWG